MAERENKKKLSKEELHQENVRLRNEIRDRDFTTMEEQQRIVDILRPKNLLVYCLVAFLPPIGIFLIWKKKDELKLNAPSRVVWTGVGLIIFYEYIALILKSLNVLG